MKDQPVKCGYQRIWKVEDFLRSPHGCDFRVPASFLRPSGLSPGFTGTPSFQQEAGVLKLTVGRTRSPQLRHDLWAGRAGLWWEGFAANVFIE